MIDPIRDLERRFNVAGRDYVLQVCGFGEHPAPVSAGPSDVVLFECVREELLDHEDDSPDRIVRDLVMHAKQYMPNAISPEQWHDFTLAAHDWVCEHHAAAAIREHESHDDV